MRTPQAHDSEIQSYIDIQDGLKRQNPTAPADFWNSAHPVSKKPISNCKKDHKTTNTAASLKQDRQK